jgi:hypothetical protein
MNIKRYLPVSLRHIALLCMLPFFAACGEEEEKGVCSFLDFVTSACINKVVEQILTGGSTGGSGSSGAGGSSGGSTGGNPVEGGTIVDPVVVTPYGSNSYDEYEPNNSFENANPIQFPEEEGNISITGGVHEADDPSDYFIVSPSRSGLFSVSLYYPCNDTCSRLELAVDDAIYISVYDQNQTSIDGTPIGTVAEQHFVMDMTAGIPYYFAVHGYNTGEQPFPYLFRISE